jgi:CBS domain-containing protein
MAAERQLRVTFRRVRGERASERRVLAVFCPRQTQAVELGECNDCPHCEGLSVDQTDRPTFLRCRWAHDADPVGVAASSQAWTEPPPDTLLQSVMTSPARCVPPDLSIDALVKLFLEQGISATPVVDERGRAIGIVSKTDVLRRFANDGHVGMEVDGDSTTSLDIGLTSELASGNRVRDVMTHVVFTLQAEASLSRAAALMAYEGVHRVVVVAADGTAIGIVSSLDILRWLASRDGYIVPSPRASVLKTS